jgi:hypothetical protein
MEKQWVLHNLSACTCSLTYPACNAHAPYCHLWPARLYNIFPHFLINRTPRMTNKQRDYIVNDVESNWGRNNALGWNNTDIISSSYYGGEGLSCPVIICHSLSHYIINFKNVPAVIPPLVIGEKFPLLSECRKSTALTAWSRPAENRSDKQFRSKKNPIL